MTRLEVALVGCKILAVYYFAGAALQLVVGIVQHVSYFLVSGMRGGWDVGRAIFGSFPWALVELLIGVLIWRMAPGIAQRIAPVVSHGSPIPSNSTP